MGMVAGCTPRNAQNARDGDTCGPPSHSRRYAILITTCLRPARVWLPRWFDRLPWLRTIPFAQLRALMAFPVELESIREAYRRG